MRYLIILHLLLSTVILNAQELEIDDLYDGFKILSVEEDANIFVVYVDESFSNSFFYINEYSEELSLVQSDSFNFEGVQSVDIVEVVKMPEKNEWYLFANMYISEAEYSMHLLKIERGEVVLDSIILFDKIAGDVQTYYDEEDELIYAFGNSSEPQIFFSGRYFFVMTIKPEDNVVVKRDYERINRIRGISEHPSDDGKFLGFSLRYFTIFDKITLDSISEVLIYEDIDNAGSSSDGSYFATIKNKLWALHNQKFVPEISNSDANYRVFLYSFDDSVKVDSFLNLNYTGIGATKKAFDFQDNIFYISLVSLTSPGSVLDFFTNQRIMAVEKGEIKWETDYITESGFRYFPEGIKRLSSGNILVYGGKNASISLNKEDFSPFMLLLSEDGDFITSTEDPSTFIELKLYPNPVVDRFHLTLENVTNEIQGDIINSLGEIVKSELILRQGDNEIYVPELPSGSYYIRLKSKGGIIGTTQFVKM